MSPAFHFSRRLTSFAFFAVLAARWVSNLTIAAEPVTDPFPAKIEKGPIQIELQPIATGLGGPLLGVAPPGDRARLFAVEQTGAILIAQDGKLLPEPFLDVADRLVKLNKDFDECGLLGLAFDPGFNDPQSPGHRRFFTYSSENDSGKPTFPFLYAEGAKPHHENVVAAWKVSATNPNRADPASRVELLRVAKPQFNHNGGMIAFGPDGFLYIICGDGGAGNDAGPGHNPETGNAQDLKTPLGKMLRIDVNGRNSDNGKYGIPADNPFAAGGGLKEIYAFGLRNPWRFCFDGPALIAADVGQNRIEMVHRVERGGNYGWRLKEGSFKFNRNGTIERETAGLPADLNDPILQYDHDEGLSITGGYVYRGKKLPELTGKYVFGDWRNPKQITTGRLFYGDVATGEIREFKIGRDDRPLGFLLKGFGQDGDGELYALGSTAAGPSGTTGVIMKIVPAAAP
ncbi:MAG TPA: PQQ-dependent sugar dehydrogenase [Chthoniobacteraceae bacterium]|jgi:glucose/arabinose dehydrogenase|nr:PQQ-dependent sugar dehydrogenase [Chthoniobacteraceae bacterium]